jgi:DNA replication licensing factor MCM5
LPQNANANARRQSDDVSKLVCIPGIIIGASRCKARALPCHADVARHSHALPRAQSKAVSLTIQCKSCKNTKSIACAAGFGGAFIPRTCDLQPGGAAGGAEACGMDPFVVLSDRSIYIDQQTLKLQENPEDVPAGEMPRNLLLVVERNAVQQEVPGTRCTVMGIYSIHQAGPAQGRGQNKAAVAIRQPYLRVVGVEADGEGSRRTAQQFSDAEARVFKASAAHAQHASASLCADT